MSIRLFACAVVLFIFSTGSSASHFLEPIGTEIPRIAPKDRFFLQSGVTLVRSDASSTVRNDDLSAPLVLEYGLSDRNQIAFEADILFRDEDGGLSKGGEKGPNEIAVGFRHLLRGDPESEESHSHSHGESKYECDCLKGNPLAFELEFAPSSDNTRGSEVKVMFLYAQNVFERHHLFLNAGFANEGHVHASGTHGYHAHYLYNAAYMVPLNRELLHGAVELNGRVTPGQTGDRAEWILRPQLIWFSLRHSLAVKFGIAFGISHDDPERGGSLLVSRMF